jgi:hypothetical protein
MKMSTSQELMDYSHSSIGMNGQVLKIIIASGPYTFENSLEYELFDDLLMSIGKEDADVVILVSVIDINIVIDNSCSHLLNRWAHLLTLNTP